MARWLFILMAAAPVLTVLITCGPLPASTFRACNEMVAAQANCFKIAPASQNELIKSCSEQYQRSDSGCGEAIEALASCLTKTPCSDMNKPVNACTSAAGTQGVVCAPSAAALSSNTRYSRGPTFNYEIWRTSPQDGFAL